MDIAGILVVAGIVATFGWFGRKQLREHEAAQAEANMRYHLRMAQSGEQYQDDDPWDEDPVDSYGFQMTYPLARWSSSSSTLGMGNVCWSDSSDDVFWAVDSVDDD